ncbi:MAG: hypothetical protein IJ187_09615 [Neisseriaceae bacterium]|nr:hypothetical protein [Neisseriaceae bacterium]
MKLLEKYCQHLVKVSKKLPFNKDNLRNNMAFVLAAETLTLTGLISLTIVYLTNLQSIEIEENRMKIIWLHCSVSFSMCMLVVLFVKKILYPYLEKHKL